MKKLLLGCLVALGGTLQAIAPTPQLLSRNVLAVLEAQEYTRGANTTLIQIPVLDQFMEDTSSGSSNHSCAYHVLRNGSCAVQAMLDPHTSTTHLATLYDKAHLYHKLAFDGDWRTLIRSGRSGIFTDNLDISEVEKLLKHETDSTNPHAALANKGIEVAYFQYASPDEPLKDDFEAFNVGERLKAIKQKLDAGEDFASLIAVYVDTPKKSDESTELIEKECTICKKEKTHKETPCCHEAACEHCWEEYLNKNNNTCPNSNCQAKIPVYPEALEQECGVCMSKTTNKETHCKQPLCEDCWNTWKKNKDDCPYCRQPNPGNLQLKTHMKPAPLEDQLAKKILLNGHYVSLVLVQAGKKRQYVLMDSDTNASLRFLASEPIKKLIEYLEGNNTPAELLPRYIPDLDTLDPQLKALHKKKIAYNRSYNKGPLLPEAPAKKTEAPSFEKKSFLGGILAVIALYACYHYYTKYKEQKLTALETAPGT